MEKSKRNADSPCPTHTGISGTGLSNWTLPAGVGKVTKNVTCLDSEINKVTFRWPEAGMCSDSNSICEEVNQDIASRTWECADSVSAPKD